MNKKKAQRTFIFGCLAPAVILAILFIAVPTITVFKESFFDKTDLIHDEMCIRDRYIISQGYHNSTFCVPTKEYKDFMNFQMREVAELVKQFVDITHEEGKEAMMFLGDHWIGTEPFEMCIRDRRWIIPEYKGDQ